MKKIWHSSSWMASLSMLFCSSAGVWVFCAFFTDLGDVHGAWLVPVLLIAASILLYLRMRAIDRAYYATTSVANRSRT